MTEKNSYEVLGIKPTDDFGLIRKAYVERIKASHPDHGGSYEEFAKIQDAYENLINQVITRNSKKTAKKIIETELYLKLNDFLCGCVAFAIIEINNKLSVFEFYVPKFTYPGTYLEMPVKELTKTKLRIRLMEEKLRSFKRIGANITTYRFIDANDFKDKSARLDIENFDGITHSIDVKPKPKNSKIVHIIPNAGFFNKNTKKRGNLIVDIYIL